MKTKNMFEQHRPRLLLEACLKSALCGLSAGFIAGFISALVTWFTPAKDLWIPITVFAGVSLIASFLFYFLKYRLTDAKNAKRLDTLGLHERLVTMVEYQNDPSTIARMQRADARATLAKIDPKTIKILIPKVIAITLLVCAFLSSGMITVNALSDNGIIRDGNEIWNDVMEDATIEYVTVSYVIEDGGILEGDEDQILVRGTDASTVTAVADDGFVFKEWSDGYAYPTRTDLKVTEDAIYTAIFTELEEGEDDGDGDGDGEGDGEEGDEPQDKPSEGEQEGEPPPPSDGEPNESPNGGGIMDPNNKIINNDEYYRDVINRYEEETNERLESSNDFSEEELDMINKYLGLV